MSNRNLVYDVGMNNGDDTAHYLECGYRVVAIEADPLLVRNARQRFETNFGRPTADLECRGWRRDRRSPVLGQREDRVELIR
jgi:hypothetical protein